jgi:hypothetical protein
MREPLYLVRTGASNLLRVAERASLVFIGVGGRKRELVRSYLGVYEGLLLEGVAF